MGLFFIDNIIFLVKINLLTIFQKLASDRNFDLEKKKFILKKTDYISTVR